MAGKRTDSGRREQFRVVDRMRLRVNPAVFAEAVLGLELDERQRELMLTLSRKVVLNCARQWGKSTMAAAKAVHRAMFRAGSLTIVMSPSSRQSAELVRKVRQLAAKAGERVKGDGENRASAVFGNGSRVVGLPAAEGTTRGFSNVSLLVVDEASRVPDPLYHSMLPTLSRGVGDLWLMSTPNGRQGFFWKAWSEGEGWLKVKAKAEECPRTSKVFLAEQRKGLTRDFFRQEYECEFVDVEDGLFKLDRFRACLTDETTNLRF